MTTQKPHDTGGAHRIFAVIGVFLALFVSAAILSWTSGGFAAKLEENRAIAMARLLSFTAAQSSADETQNHIDILEERVGEGLLEAYVLNFGGENELGLTLGGVFVANRFESLIGLDPMRHDDSRQHIIYDRLVRTHASAEGYAERLSSPPPQGLDHSAPYFVIESERAHDGTPCLNVNVPLVSPEGVIDGVAGITLSQSEPPPALPIGLLILAFGVLAVLCVVLGTRLEKRVTWALAVVFLAGGLWAVQTDQDIRKNRADAFQTELISLVTPAESSSTDGQDVLDFVLRDYRDQRIDLVANRFAPIENLGTGGGPLALGLLIAFGLCALLRKSFVAAIVHARNDPWAYLYVVPAMIGMLLLVFVPFVFGFVLAFFERDAGRFVPVGLEHFGNILGGDSRSGVSFYWTLFVTLLWTACNIVLHVAIGLALALALNDSKLRFKRVYRVLLILPWAIPNYITALIWKGMFDANDGAVNRVLVGIGFDKVDWLGDSFLTAFTANLVTNVWLGFPFMMVVSLGALQSIPKELYEAANVDGASRWQQFREITLPLLKPALFPAIILGTIWTFNMFNIIYLVSGGGPNHSTEILITEAYKVFALHKWGYAAAYSVVIFVILLTFSWGLNRISRATEGAFE